MSLCGQQHLLTSFCTSPLLSSSRAWLSLRVGSSSLRIRETGWTSAAAPQSPAGASMGLHSRCFCMSPQLPHLFFFFAEVGLQAFISCSYPAIYTITVLPIAIVRFRAFHDQHVPFAATVVSDVLFSSSGLFNVILFALTRPSLLPRRNSQYDSQGISFSLRSRVTEDVGDRSYVGRPPMAIARGGATHLSTFLDGSDLHFDDRYNDRVTLDISAKGRLSPSIRSYGDST